MPLSDIQKADIARSAYGYIGAGETSPAKIAGEIIKKAQRSDPGAYSDLGDQTRVINTVRAAIRASNAGRDMNDTPAGEIPGGLPVDPSGAAYSENYIYRVVIKITNPDTLEVTDGGLVVVTSNTPLSLAQVQLEAIDAVNSGDAARVQSGAESLFARQGVIEPIVISAGRTR